MHLYTPANQELSTVTGIHTVDTPHDEATRNMRLTRGAWCTGVAALRRSRGLMSGTMPTELDDVAHQGERAVVLQHRVVAADEAVYAVRHARAFLDAKPQDIPAIDIETRAKSLPNDDEFVTIHAFRIGHLALTDPESSVVYPSIHHVEAGDVGAEVELGSADWSVALFSIVRITESRGLAEV